jgi:hypothetical protein
MRKVIILGVIIILFIIAIVIAASVFSYRMTEVKQKPLSSGQVTFLEIFLHAGQSVTGSLNFTRYDINGRNGTTGFEVYSPDDITIVHYATINSRGNFAFKANVDGYYTFDLLYSNIHNTVYIDYQYTISSPILGLDPAVFIYLVIVIGVILALVIGLSNLHSARIGNKKEANQTIP